MKNVQSTQDLLLQCPGKEPIKVAIGFDQSDPEDVAYIEDEVKKLHWE